jgi:hypothetical protein
MDVEMVSPDDFKCIKGIGPAVERRLHQAGIFSFAQLAALSAVEVAGLVTNLAGFSAERIAQQDWMGQARQLAASPTELPPDPMPKEQQYYATFTVELLLDEANNVHQTRIVHIQDGVEASWAGWEEARLTNFVAQYASLHLQPLLADSSPLLQQQAAKHGPTGKPGLRTLTATSSRTSSPPNFLEQDEPFDVHLALDLTEMDMPHGHTFNYRATVYAKSVGGGSRQIIAEARGSSAVADTLEVKMAGTLLFMGLYRLEAAVTLTLLSPKTDFSVFLEGSLLQIY